jgi:hypothetical protein
MIVDQYKAIDRFQFEPKIIDIDNPGIFATEYGPGNLVLAFIGYCFDGNQIKIFLELGNLVDEKEGVSVRENSFDRRVVERQSEVSGHGLSIAREQVEIGRTESPTTIRDGMRRCQRLPS